MVDVAPSGVVDRVALQRRTLWTLRFSQVPGQAATAGMVAVVTLLASEMLGSDRLAGIGSATFTVGSAFTAVFLAAYMRRHGRRAGLSRALLVGAVGSAVAATGGQLGWFPVFVVGMLAFGAGQAATLQQRYVAADLAPASEQGSAIAAIVWIGVVGAVLGPMLNPFERGVAERLGLDGLIGPFLFAAVLFAVAAVVIWTRLRPDPLEVVGGLDQHAERSHPFHLVRVAASAISVSPGARLGLAAMAGSQAVMVGVMTMTPPYMKDHGQAGLSAFVIAVHVLGMFGFAPLVGKFADRSGPLRAVQVGAVILGSGTVTAVLAGYVPVMIFIGLFLLGLGWSFGLIAGMTLLTGSVPASAKVEVQGTGDLTLSLCGAAAAFASGFIKASLGFPFLANLATGLAVILFAFAIYTAARHTISSNI